MNNKLHIEITGQGPAMVLIHGWGLNSAVWQQILPSLALHFEVHLVDLPGFGHSQQVQATADLNDWASLVVEAVGKPAIVIGWSLGGLIATQMAITFPKQVKQLITIASSPKFVEADGWVGIKPDVLSLFQSQLNSDFATTLERFLAIQALGSPDAKKDIKALHHMLKQRPMPQQSALKDGLYLLEQVDLRSQLSILAMPFLRIYGRLDSLVNHRAIKQVDKLAPQSQSVTLAKASHAPFISHPQEFLTLLLNFLLVNKD